MKHAALLAAVACLGMGAFAQEGSEDIELTVYNQGVGLVKDMRTLPLTDGRQTVRFTDVAAQIDPTSVRFRSVGDEDAVALLEQNFQYDLVDRARLLQKYLGKEIVLVTYGEDGRPRERRTATLLAGENGVVSVAKIDDEIVLNPRGVVELPALPEGLIVRPTLLWELRSDAEGPTKCEVSYMTAGISWSSDYVLVVNADDTRGELSGWVTITNDSGATYADAALKLIAGDVAVQPQPRVGYGGGGYGGGLGAVAPETFQEKAFFEYHLYSLPRRTTIADRETKQIQLLAAPEIGVRKLFVFEPSKAWRWGGESPETKVGVMLEAENSEEQGLGMPLPMGRVRVFKADSDKSLQFVGEDQIDHTPRDETVRLYIGNAFDLVGSETHTDHREVRVRAHQDSYRVSLRNRKEVDTVDVTYVTHFEPWCEWEILEESCPHVKKDAHTAEFTVTLAPGEEREISYTVERTW